MLDAHDARQTLEKQRLALATGGTAKDNDGNSFAAASSNAVYTVRQSSWMGMLFARKDFTTSVNHRPPHLHCVAAAARNAWFRELAARPRVSSTVSHIQMLSMRPGERARTLNRNACMDLEACFFAYAMTFKCAV